MNTAMILCAGFGSRMKDYTKDIPKPMLLISGKPILEYTIKHLAKLNITNIIINLFYKGEQISSYFEDGKKHNVKITYIQETELLGTSGSVKNAQKFLNESENFLVLYGDVISNENYLILFNNHISKSNAVGTIVLHERERSNSVVEMDSENKIVRFIERPNVEIIDKKQNWINSGLYCFNKKILDLIPDNTFSDFPKDIFRGLVEQGQLYGYPLKGYRCAIDSPERLKNAENDISKYNLF